MLASRSLHINTSFPLHKNICISVILLELTLFKTHQVVIIFRFVKAAVLACVIYLILLAG